MIAGFAYEALPMRVRFASGSLHEIAQEMDHLRIDRALILATPEQRELADDVAASLGDRAAGVFAEARMHVPVDVARRAGETARRLRASGCIAVGGGSTIGLGKAVALDSGLPIIAVPTTYAGSEMTPIWGLTEDGAKRTGRDRKVLPASVVYDPDLTTTLPVGLSVTSGVNAMAHAVEALYAPDASPLVSLMAAEGVRALAASIPGIIADPAAGEARKGALYGAWLCGACLGATTMSLHHKICHVLGGTLDLPHAPSHTVVLPHVLAYNQPNAPQARAALAGALGGDDPAGRLWELIRGWGAPVSLRELGMKETDITIVMAQVLAQPYANPRPVTRDGLTALLTRAWSGEPPAAG
ncbi:maleylacetate reductase [Actinomadura fibrosa]|uniref:Maleylacetate reductase n=1 Tax=Actinomadura fibrosa TaxID=111802 RepID=A0ABW2Y1E0_9ACTN|nr:maleylacetate reductase [Actinomadura fibrosa]